MKIFALFVLLAFAVPASAFYPLFNTTAEDYEAFAVEYDEEHGATYLGELSGFPDLYEINLAATTSVSLRLLQLNDGEPEALILLVVRVLERGVTEVARIGIAPEALVPSWNHAVALSFLESASLNESFGPGTYRIEVSTPDNQAKYALILGAGGESVNYYSKLAGLALVYEFFELSKMRMFLSMYVYLPILIFGVIVLLLLQRKLRRQSRLHA